MEILIIRHGDPDYDRDSLTKKGWKEAELLSERLCKLDIKAFYCSPLGRAQDTAKPTLEKMNRQMQIMPWLREFEGTVIRDGKRVLAWDQLPEYWKEIPVYYSRDDWYKTDLMQSANVEEEYAWVTAELDKLLAEHGYLHENGKFRVLQENHDRIALFCHYGVSCVLLAHLLDMSPMILWHNFVMQPSAVTTLTTEERRPGTANFRMRSYGDISHLYAGGEEPAFAARFCECFSDDTRHD